jgi:small subunit ribosomal protein S6
MALYETVWIARQDVTSAQVEAMTETFAGIITEKGGTVVKTEQWGLRTLAYKINKNRKGHYFMYHLDASPEAIAEMERQMGLSEDVLRLLTTRVEAHEEGPSVMMQQKGNRDYDDRPRRREYEDGPGMGGMDMNLNQETAA